MIIDLFHDIKIFIFILLKKSVEDRETILTHSYPHAHRIRIRTPTLITTTYH